MDAARFVRLPYIHGSGDIISGVPRAAEAEAVERRKASICHPRFPDDSNGLRADASSSATETGIFCA